MNKLTTCLWYDGTAEETAAFMTTRKFDVAVIEAAAQPARANA